jgi:hypothetical protein
MRAVAVVILAALVVAPACKRSNKKKKAKDVEPIKLADIAGLDAMPYDASVVIGAHAKVLAKSSLVARAVEQMFVRDPELRTRIDTYMRECKFDPAVDLDSVIIGMGDLPSPPVTAGRVVMAATGNFEEAQLASCVSRALQSDGGSLTTKQVLGRTFYRADNPTTKRVVWFTFGTPRTVLVSSSEQWLTMAVDDGKRVLDNDRLAAEIERANREGAGLWMAGELAGRTGQGIVTLTRGAVSKPPASAYGFIDLSDGIRGELAVVMTSEKDVKGAISYIKPQLEVLAMMAQGRALGRLVSKVGVDSEAATVYLRVSLTEDELKQALSRIDTKGGPTQDTPAPAKEH